ncbi:hypothetical protein K504DRAFT_464921, partial [Pleomassaria siparia CBS 279.74]
LRWVLARDGRCFHFRWVCCSALLCSALLCSALLCSANHEISGTRVAGRSCCCHGIDIPGSVKRHGGEEVAAFIHSWETWSGQSLVRMGMGRDVRSLQLLIALRAPSLIREGERERERERDG